MLLATVKLTGGGIQKRLSSMGFSGNIPSLGVGGEITNLNQVTGVLAQTPGPYIVYEVKYGVGRISQSNPFGIPATSTAVGYIIAPSINYILNNSNEFSGTFGLMAGCVDVNIIWYG